MSSRPPKLKSEQTQVAQSDEKIELRNLLFQAEALQHNRVYYFLVAETIFFLAAGTALQFPFVIRALAIAGILIGLLFTIINLKNYFRILWLSARLERVDGLYHEYLHFCGFRDLVHLGLFSRIMYACFIMPSDSKPGGVKAEIAPGTQRWHHTGILFTWGLLTIVGGAWCALLYFSYHNPTAQSLTPADTSKSVDIYYSRQYKSDTPSAPK